MTKKIKVKNITDFLKDASDQFAQEYAQELLDRVVDKSPVKSGKLKGSNRLSVNKPDYEFGPVDPSGSAAKGYARKVKVTIEDDIYISNGAPYAGYVEMGTSKQRPQPFMRTTASEAALVAKAVAKRLK